MTIGHSGGWSRVKGMTGGWCRLRRVVTMGLDRLVRNAPKGNWECNIGSAPTKKDVHDLV